MLLKQVVRLLCLNMIREVIIEYGFVYVGNLYEKKVL